MGNNLAFAPNNSESPCTGIGKPLAANVEKTKQFAKKMGNLLPMDKIIYCHCRSGGRVLMATRILEKLGYDIRPLKAGYSELLMGGFRAAD